MVIMKYNNKVMLHSRLSRAKEAQILYFIGKLKPISVYYWEPAESPNRCQKNKCFEEWVRAVFYLQRNIFACLYVCMLLLVGEWRL